MLFSIAYVSEGFRDTSLRLECLLFPWILKKEKARWFWTNIPDHTSSFFIYPNVTLCWTLKGTLLCHYTYGRLIYLPLLHMPDASKTSFLQSQSDPQIDGMVSQPCQDWSLPFLNSLWLDMTLGKGGLVTQGKPAIKVSYLFHNKLEH